MKTKPNYWYNQSGVIPFRQIDEGIEILLITSRKGKKWIVPKGIIEPNMTAIDSALKEALEEAGASGKILNNYSSNYKFKKWGGKCELKLFGLEVLHQKEKWDEDFRQRKWIKQELLNEYIADKKLLKSIHKLKKHLRVNSKLNI